MRLSKSQVIVAALAYSITGGSVVLAEPSYRDCRTVRAHVVQTCRCDPQEHGSTRYRGRLIAGFETEYDVEKWEKAYRQGRAHSDSRSKRGQCGAS